MNTNVFTQSFLTRVVDTLNEECPEGTGQRITRTDLVSKLDLPKGFESVIGVMIKQDLLEGWSSFKGLHGGIGRIGEKAPKKARASSSVSVSDEFVQSVANVLSELVTAGSDPVSRKKIAEALGKPGSKTEAMISAALKSEVLAETYTSRRGPGGGIILQDLPEESKSEESESEEMEESPKTLRDSFPPVENLKNDFDLHNESHLTFEDEVAAALSLDNDALAEAV